MRMTYSREAFSDHLVIILLLSGQLLCVVDGLLVYISIQHIYMYIYYLDLLLKVI